GREQSGSGAGIDARTGDRRPTRSQGSKPHAPCPPSSQPLGPLGPTLELAHQDHSSRAGTLETVSVVPGGKDFGHERTLVASCPFRCVLGAARRLARTLT